MSCFHGLGYDSHVPGVFNAFGWTVDNQVGVISFQAVEEVGVGYDTLVRDGKYIR